MDDWSAPVDIGSLKSADFDTPGLVFAAEGHLFRTTGERVGQGGMGHAYHIDMRKPGDPQALRAVAKIFRWEFLLQLRQDESSRRFFQHNQVVMERLTRLRHLHLLPILAAQPITDNHIIITPYAGEALVSLVMQDQLSPFERVQLLCGAVRGLRAMHDAGMAHCDFTLRNVLVHTRDSRRNALLFDFDLSLALDELTGVSYSQYYGGRIVGAPEYSLAPEQLDPVLEQALLSPMRDFYAVGTALFGLFTDHSIYGDAADLPSLLEAITDGIVRQGKSRVPYPAEVPPAVRQVIDRCLERDPAHRYPDASALIRAMELAANTVSPEATARFRTTLGYVQVERRTRLRDVFEDRPDQSVALEQIQEMHTTLARHGYVLESSLGKVKAHPIYLASPDPTLVATGRFPQSNAYRKIVTAIDVSEKPDAEEFVEAWLGRIVPILQSVRRAQSLTALHKVLFDRPTGQLLLFTEYLDDARFGSDLVRHELTLEESLGLGLIIAAQIARLHEHGLAHNNVTLKSLLFKWMRETGEVRPLFVGLVEPSFEPAALQEDVRRLAGVLLTLIRRSRVNEAAPEHRPRLDELLAFLQALERGEGQAPTIGQLMDLLQQGLALIEPNFAIVRRYGGDPLAFAYMLTRHSLYRYLWGAPPPAAPPVVTRNSGQSGSHV